LRGHYDRILKLPYRGAPQTVGVIVKGALDSQNHYGVRELAEHICAGLPSKAYIDEYLAIYRWVLANTRYMRDPRTVELVRAPYVVVEQLKSGVTPSLDCDDSSSLICALVLAVGGQCAVATVAFRHMFHNGHRQHSHVFAQAKEPKTGQQIILDPVAANHTAQMRSRVVHGTIWPVA
jgi:hypothetical protein